MEIKVGRYLVHEPSRYRIVLYEAVTLHHSKSTLVQLRTLFTLIIVV
jgi:hypothetical protein